MTGVCGPVSPGPGLHPFIVPLAFLSPECGTLFMPSSILGLRSAVKAEAKLGSLGSSAPPGQSGLSDPPDTRPRKGYRRQTGHSCLPSMGFWEEEPFVLHLEADMGRRHTRGPSQECGQLAPDLRLGQGAGAPLGWQCQGHSTGCPEAIEAAPCSVGA